MTGPGKKKPKSSIWSELIIRVIILICAVMSEKLCLKWNDFQGNVNSAFGSLREDSDFTDVTLACGDGWQIEAHKVILAAQNPFSPEFIQT